MQDNRRGRYDDEGRGRGRWGFNRSRETSRPRPFDEPRSRGDETMYAERYRGEDRSWRDQGDGFAESGDRWDDEGRYGAYGEDGDFPSHGLRDRYTDYDRGLRGQHQTQAVGGQRAGWGSWRAGWIGAPEPDYTGRGPRNYRRSDERIREDVCDRLTDDPRVDASDLTIDVRSCEVTLSGTVADREQKRRAEDVAESVSGVRDVTNNIRVARPQEVSDQSSRSSIVGAGSAPSGTKTKPTVDA